MELKTAKEMREVSRNTKFNKDFQRIIEDIAFSIDDCASKGYTTCKFRHEDLYYQGRKIADAVRNELEKRGFKVESYIFEKQDFDNQCKPIVDGYGIEITW